MNLRLLYEIQTTIFRIIFILFGLYLILVLIKEIFMLFCPPAPTKINPQETSIVNDNDSTKKITRMQIKEPNNILYITPESKSVSPSPVKKNIKKRRKSRRSKK